MITLRFVRIARALEGSEHSTTTAADRNYVSVDSPGGYDGWSDASVDEVVARLEENYRDRGAARKVGLEAAALMADWSWQKQVPRLLSMLELYCP